MRADLDRGPEVMLCPSCLHPNDPLERFCRKCGAPISNLSVVCPLESTKAEGFALRRMVSGPPRKIIVIGMWLLLLPQILLFASSAWHDPGYGQLLFMVPYSVLLYLVTRNYMTKRKTSFEKTSE